VITGDMVDKHNEAIDPFYIIVSIWRWKRWLLVHIVYGVGIRQTWSGDHNHIIFRYSFFVGVFHYLGIIAVDYDLSVCGGWYGILAETVIDVIVVSMNLADRWWDYATDEKSNASSGRRGHYSLRSKKR
jgi:hypothetical protein